MNNKSQIIYKILVDITFINPNVQIYWEFVWEKNYPGQIYGK